MQRVSHLYIRPGMELASPVYDNWGDLVLTKGTRLTARDIAQLDDIGVGELFVRSRQACDVHAEPLVSPQLEGALARALRRALIDLRAVLTSRGRQHIDLTLTNHLLDELIGMILSSKNPEASVSGCFSLRDYDYIHPVKAAGLSILVGRTLRMDRRELKDLGMAALLQNAGYLLLPRGMLDKPGLLNGAEKKEMRKHPYYGSQLITRMTDVNQHVAAIVAQHHERWNGSGYPSGLRWNGICRAARILAIADVCFALASKRPHRDDFLPDFAAGRSIRSATEAIEYILSRKGRLFDPSIVTAFTRVAPVYPSGTMVTLNDGRFGIVCRPNPQFLTRPLIRIIDCPLGPGPDTARTAYDANGESSSGRGRDLDLSREEKSGVCISGFSDY